jgi:hypothetical protein
MVIQFLSSSRDFVSRTQQKMDNPDSRRMGWMICGALLVVAFTLISALLVFLAFQFNA